MTSVVVAERLSHVQLFETSCTVACQAPLSVKFSRQESWSRLPFPPPGDLPNAGIKAVSPSLWADSLPLSLRGRICEQPSPNICSLSLEKIPVLDLWFTNTGQKAIPRRPHQIERET